MSKLAISVLITAVVAASWALDCSRVIFKEQEGLLSYLARINFTVPVPTDENGWLITMFFDQNFTGVGVWEGFVEYNGTEKWAEIRNRDETDAVLRPGQNKNMTFRIRWGVGDPPYLKPEAISTRFQDVELCQ